MTEDTEHAGAAMVGTAKAVQPKADGATADSIVGTMASGKKLPVILFSVLWVAWIAFLIWMLAI